MLVSLPAAVLAPAMAGNPSRTATSSPPVRVGAEVLADSGFARLAGKRVIITGGSTGIGAATAGVRPDGVADDAALSSTAGDKDAKPVARNGVALLARRPANQVARRGVGEAAARHPQRPLGLGLRGLPFSTSPM